MVRIVTEEFFFDIHQQVSIVWILINAHLSVVSVDAHFVGISMSYIEGFHLKFTLSMLCRFFDSLHMHTVRLTSTDEQVAEYCH